MSDAPPTGHDGPYAAPVRLGERRVPREWIDYNGHMNVAYYAMAFDHATDALLEEHLGLGETRAARAGQGAYSLQMHLTFLGELREGEPFTIAAQLLDCDAKRMHLVLEMTTADGGRAAVSEQLLMNVDLSERRSRAYPDWAQSRLERMRADHAGLARPPETGRGIGIRRRG